jgi:hypothetical protein
VGSPLPSRHDPVTTDPEGDEDPRRRGAGAARVTRANLPPAQYAGPRSDLDIPSYISGYFDGEGCFTVSISPRTRLRTGWEVRPSVSVSQNADRRQVLDIVAQYFSCGSIRRDPGDRTLKWESRSLDDLRRLVLPHFYRYPLLSTKQLDLELFDEVCRRMAAGEHLRRDGLIEIVELARHMNPSGKRRFSPDVIINDLSEVKA